MHKSPPSTTAPSTLNHRADRHSSSTSPELLIGESMDKHVNSLDRISALPDEVLSQMLSFLPTRDAVRTSILSKSWRYLSTMTSCLSFDDTPCFDDSDSDEDKIIEATQLFKKFVDKVLESHQATAIKKFLLVCLGDYDISDLNRWVRSGFQESVQELHLEYIKFRDFSSMEQLFSCCGMLQNLTLICCTCYSYRFGHAIYRTEKLKMLKVKECYFKDGIFEIDAPNLGYLNWKFNRGLKVVLSWKDSGSFVKAKLTFNYRYSDCDIVLGFRGFDQELLNAAASKATKLVLLDAMVELFRSLNDEEEIQMPVFHCLSKLVLSRWDYGSSEYVTNLLSSPQLKTVIFDMDSCRYSRYSCYLSASESESESELELIPSEEIGFGLMPVSCYAEEIEVLEYCGHEWPCLLIGYLLRNASVLKKMTVVTSCKLDSEELEKIRNELLMLPRASIDCCLEIIKPESEPEPEPE